MTWTVNNDHGPAPMKTGKNQCAPSVLPKYIALKERELFTDLQSQILFQTGVVIQCLD